MKTKKIRAGVFSFTACYGCQLQLFKAEEFMETIKAIDFVDFELVSEKSDEKTALDAAFVEGAIARAEQVPLLKKIRERTSFLVAIGACACDGGIPAIKSFCNEAEAERTVYSEDFRKNLHSISPRPIDAHVKVDYYMRGCPVERTEFHKVARALALGRRPREKRQPVCVECKIKENVCLFELGRTCLGPITNGGCKALCPSNNAACEGCRGASWDANLPAFVGLLERYNVPRSRIKQMLQRFSGRNKEFEEFVKKL
ncbi:TPA: NADH:ubiquinone oxidoreductase [Candidatus Micrarchaeota archaeon]|nr:NADH:ubiquinone oxidoreductase [Candidatus Micrarchaeota archaeon]